MQLTYSKQTHTLRTTHTHPAPADEVGVLSCAVPLAVFAKSAQRVSTYVSLQWIDSARLFLPRHAT